MTGVYSAEAVDREAVNYYACRLAADNARCKRSLAKATRGMIRCQGIVTLNVVRYVRKMAKRMAGGNRSQIPDLVSEGILGVMRALEKFDPFAENRFLTYATYWIRWYMQRHFAACRPLPVPVSVMRNQASIERDAAGSSRKVSAEEILHARGKGKRAMRSYRQGEAAVKASYGNLDLVGVNRQSGGEGMMDWAMECATSLSPVAARFLSEFFGGGKQNLRAAARKVGIPKSAARSFLENILDYLRSCAESQGLSASDFLGGPGHFHGSPFAAEA
jgi:RNA polymerase sigma factor (sigma-70 family)